MSYFQFCAELLEAFKDDERIMAICGMNHETVSEHVSSDYFFSKAYGIWGMATWKRVIDKRNYYLEHPINDEYSLSLLKKNTKNNRSFWKSVVGYRNDPNFGGHPRGGEYWFQFDLYTQNRVVIVPKYNMINNIGCTDNATHAHSEKLLPHGIRKIFNMRTYEYDFPLKHPQYVIPDLDYEKRLRRIMGYAWYIQWYRIIEIGFLTIRYTGLKGFRRRLTKYLKKRKTIEK